MNSPLVRPTTVATHTREYACANRSARFLVAPGRARRTVPFLERFLGVFSRLRNVTCTSERT